MVGGGFLPGSNFQPDDITDKNLKNRLEKIKEKKPNLFSPDISDLHETVRGDQFLGFEVTDRNKKNSLPDYDYDHQAKLAIDEDPGVRLNLAQNPNLHPDHQAKLMIDEEPIVKRELATNPNLHPDHQAKLAIDKAPYVKQFLAKNPNLHPDHQAKLAIDKIPGVRLFLAKNPNLHPDHQAKLMIDEEPYVKRFLAKNPNLHPDHQAKLAIDEDPGVRLNLAQNPNLHPDFKKELERNILKEIRNLSAAHEKDPKNSKIINDIRVRAEILPTLRKNILIDKLKDPNTSLDFIKRYEYSHNDDIAKEAQERLKKK
jgi:hypothetical protein